MSRRTTPSARSDVVFLCRVNRRSLYEQVLGWATRQCPEHGKETFRIFNAVNPTASAGSYGYVAYGGRSQHLDAAAWGVTRIRPREHARPFSRRLW